MLFYHSKSQNISCGFIVILINKTCDIENQTTTIEYRSPETINKATIVQRHNKRRKTNIYKYVNYFRFIDQKYVLLFSKTCVETKKGTDPNILAKKVHGTFEKAQKREYTVMFLVMSTRIGNGNTFTVIVECVKVENAESRKNFWLQEGYIDQKPTQSLWFVAHSRYKYRCKLSKTLQNLQVVGESDEVYLQFHARRINYQCFTLHIAENVDEAFGEIQIFAVKTKKSFREENKDLSVRPEKPDKFQPEKALTSISVQLYKYSEQVNELITPNVPPISPVMDDYRRKSRTNLTPVNDNQPLVPKFASMKTVNLKEEAKGDPSWRGK
jgi:hypothetical protein